MALRFEQLSEPWRAAFTEAIEAYLVRDSVPIGAVIVNSEGSVVARGGNDFSSDRLAHAELNALRAIQARGDRAQCEVYSTLEPCPMCTGAIRISQLRAVHFAARDPSAGSSEFLTANEFMREFPCTVNMPHDAQLETVVVSLVMEYRQRTGHRRWFERWRKYHQVGAIRGQRLFDTASHARWVAASASPESIYDEVVSMSAAV